MNSAKTALILCCCLIGICIIRIVSLLLASIAFSRILRIKNDIYNIIWAVIMFLLVFSDIAVCWSPYFGWAAQPIVLTKLILNLWEVVVLVLSYGIGCQPKGLCQVNDIFKVFITSCDLLCFICIISETLVLPRCGALGKNDNSKNPVPPVEDKIVGGNENINRGTDEITIPDIDEV
ncbi:uncharacterized protein OCT59_013538 [Rhizophagus irregularis]|uniref:Uncharacterized protein n=1 Tax=Rhizophagus irregularis (strain DAOM 181602 / DAOM 197198 / MUCL 43194) TaxID=747089 RepID=U9UKE5_RHIID|nr:hypothetical protein OCT59_013538 [Rhizophagus irregularis]GBC45648.1 hypothetical protein GLOIN_2v1494636 [Rhizophagus irregularis DAOM 181602=DAOM 197198]